MKYSFTLFLLLLFTIPANAKGNLENFLNGLNTVNKALQKTTQKNIIGYDTIYQTVTKKVLIETKYTEEAPTQSAHEIFVHSNSIIQHPRTIYSIKIPKVQQNELTEKKVIGLSYWISVDQGAREQMNSALSGLVNYGVKYALTANGLGAFSGVSKYVANFTPKTKQDIRYKIEYDEKVVQKWYTSDYIGDLLSVKSNAEVIYDLSDKDCVYFCMFNNNMYTKVLVYLAYTFIYEINVYETRQEREIVEIRPIYE